MKKKRQERLFSKKGISPVVATVLLIVMVIVIGLIIFLWFRSFVPESGEKFGRNIGLVCNEVVFEQSYSPSTGILTISNTGNVPLYSIKLKISGPRSYTTRDIKDIDDAWPALGLRSTLLFSSIDIRGELDGAEEVMIIPVLAGTSAEGEQTYTCEESQGQELNL